MRGHLKGGKKMIIHKRKIGRELLYYRALNRRTQLNQSARKLLDNHERGYQGELNYDEVYDDSLNHLYVFRGIYLKIDNSTIQCDSLIVSDNGFILHEIKNYSGNYAYEDEKWLVRNFQISEDPLSQLKRTMNNLLKIKYNNNFNFAIEGKIIFPNIDFSLNSAHENIWKYIVLRNQLRRYLNSFKDYPVTDYATQLVDFINAHIVEDPFFKEKANFNELKKGVYCRACGSFDLTKSKVQFKCNSCNHIDTVHTVILLAIADLSILFYDEKITRSKIMTLLDGKVSSSTVTRILQKYCLTVQKGAWTAYKFKYYDFDEAYSAEIRTWRYQDSPIRLLS